MNANLVNIIKRIAAEQGEAILGGPQRLKGFINDYAKNEPADDRPAFGRCIEAGAYNELKIAPDAQRRAVVKKLLARKVNANTGIDLARCADALDVLEAALYTAQYSEQPVTQTLPVPSPDTNTSNAGARPISRKTALFGIAAGAGALVGELVSEGFRLNSENSQTTFIRMAANVALWAALIGLGISAGLLIAQHIFLKKRPNAAILIKTALIGISIGAVAGGFAQIVFAFTASISTLMEIISRIVCWGILGWGASFYVPNYPAKRAMLAGALGGLIGGAAFRALFVFGLSDVVMRLAGIGILGLFIGLMISFIEEALRKAWLTIIWGRNETTTISLGQKPVSFGASREADVFLSHRPNEQNLPPIRAVFTIEDDKVVMDDRLTGGRQQLQHGSQVDLGRVRVMVNIRTGK